MKIISGGQTGVDRAALDAAIHCGLEHGGWCPKGRRAEDGRIPDRYKLIETKTSQYPVRTVANVRESEGTLIITMSEVLSRGTELTQITAAHWGRPSLHIALRSHYDNVGDILAFIQRFKIGTLNVAGSRESGAPGIYADTFKLLVEVFERLKIAN